MSASNSPSRLPVRMAPLAACLSMALALGSTPEPLLAATRTVENCTDGGPGSGSLRDMVGIAGSGDTIDLSQLPTKCGMAHSTITLMNGEIVVDQQDLTLQGPYSDAESVAIVAAPGSQTRVLHHAGAGLLAINALTIANGNLQAGAADSARGGCIFSSGDIHFSRSIATGCTAVGGSAFGGGIYAYGSLVMIASTVSGSNAIGSAWGSGGGVFAKGALYVKYSTLSGNEASTFGGGAYTDLTAGGAYASIVNSTIEGNTAKHDGGATLYSVAGVTIANSTISGNAGSDTGGVAVYGEVDISNSTIAFNAGDGIAVWGGPATSLELQSSIVAENVLTFGYFDLNLEASTATISGSDNLVMTTNADLSGIATITSSPKLGLLQFNGGATRTHALLRGSPAIGSGNNTGGFDTDQRGPGYPRTTGASASTDMGAFQFDSIFADGLEW